jgi:hypothetical protein
MVNSKNIPFAQNMCKIQKEKKKTFKKFMPIKASKLQIILCVMFQLQQLFPLLLFCFAYFFLLVTDIILKTRT